MPENPIFITFSITIASPVSLQSCLMSVFFFLNVAVILNVKADFKFFVGLSLCKLYSFYNDVQNNT